MRLKIVLTLIICFSFITGATAGSKWLFLTTDIGSSRFGGENTLGKYWESGPAFQLGVRLCAPSFLNNIISAKGSVEYQYHNFRDGMMFIDNINSGDGNYELKGKDMSLFAYQAVIHLCIYIPDSFSPYVNIGKGRFRLNNDKISYNSNLNTSYYGRNRWIEYSINSCGVMRAINQRINVNVNLSWIYYEERLNNERWIEENKYSHYGMLTIGLEYNLF